LAQSVIVFLHPLDGSTDAEIHLRFEKPGPLHSEYLWRATRQQLAMKVRRQGSPALAAKLMLFQVSGALRRPGETYSDVILKLVESEAQTARCRA
jgi:hypothetical protein